MPLIDERNPYDPDAEGPPLRLTFDSHSLSGLGGREAEEAEFLYSLCDAEEIDGLVTWATPGFAPNIPAAVMGEERGHRDSVKVTMLGEVGGFIGGIPYIDQWRELAEQLGLTGRDRERVIETGPRLAFHESSKRHLFVCGDRGLLAQRGRSPYTYLWKGVFSVRETLELVGAALRARGKVYEEVRRGYSSAITNYGVRFHLAVAAMPNRRRMAKWVRGFDPREPRRQEMESFLGALHQRASELLRAREGVEREQHRFVHNNATADEALYHLRAAVAALAAACDSLASLAAIALELDLDGEDPLRLGISQDRFRSALKKAGRESTKRAVSEASPFLALLKAFRDPIVHQAGPTGRTVHHVGAPAFTESEITSRSVEQIEAISRLPGGRRRAAHWGLRSGAPAPSLAPLPFVTLLALEGMALLDRLLQALAVDLELPPEDDGSVTEEWKLTRLRLLSGFDPGYAEEVSPR
jgi:hypothetical protein